MHQKLDELSAEYTRLERMLVETKLTAATLDMEADELTVEVQRKNGQLDTLMARNTQLEAEV